MATDLWQSFFSGSRKACARLLTRADNDPGFIPEMRKKLSGRLGKALRIGITGPPGVGKSTLTSSLAKGLADKGHRIGIIAVDPSSPFTGGAFMGDRIRMEALTGDERIFMRSMASRQGHGGLSPATPYVADVLEGFGMDRILIETVGVGQAEIDVLACTDLVVLVLQPSTGDAIQTMKAGIIEAADLIVVNKADLPGVESVIQSLRFLFSLGGPRRGKPVPMIVETSALQNTGIEKAVEALETLSQTFVESGRHLEKRRERIAAEIEEAIKDKLWEQYSKLTSADEQIRKAAAELAESGDTPFPIIESALSRVKMEATRGKKED